MAANRAQRAPARTARFLSAQRPHATTSPFDGLIA
jgi:hypothetical protein